MTYIDGFVIAVPTANKQKFIDHARTADGVFMDLGATRIVECWGDDVPDGHTTDFSMAVKAEPDEVVCFSWIQWADKATRDACFATMTGWMENPETADPRIDPSINAMPFDGKRMIFGGFAAILDTGATSGVGYIDGFVIPVPTANQREYLRVAEGSAPIFMDLGASRVVECWGDDVKKGHTTDFYGAVKAKEDEAVLFSWIEYPDKAARDIARERMMTDPRFATLGAMPFDGKRMIFGGFVPVVTMEK